MYQTLAGSSLFELYINYLFSSDEVISQESKKIFIKLFDFWIIENFYLFLDVTEIFEECYKFTMKSIGIDILEMTPNAKITLNCLINSVKVTLKILKLLK